MAHCDYWWYAGGVEWCDLMGGNCRCGGWEESCALRRRRKKASRAVQMRPEPEDRDRFARHRQFSH